MILQTNMDQFGNVVREGLFHAFSLVVFNGMNAQFQFVGNHFRAEAFGTIPDDFKFADRQP